MRTLAFCVHPYPDTNKIRKCRCGRRASIQLRTYVKPTAENRFGSVAFSIYTCEPCFTPFHTIMTEVSSIEEEWKIKISMREFKLTQEIDFDRRARV